MLFGEIEVTKTDQGKKYQMTCIPDIFYQAMFMLNFTVNK